MPKFTRKPTVIEAEQFWPKKKPWPNDVVERLIVFDGEHHHSGYRLRTVFGMDPVDPGDWIVTDGNGQRWSCSPDRFKEEYQPVDEKGETT